MSKELRCTITDEEYDRVSAHVAAKGRFSNVANYIRFVVFTDLDRGRSGAHHPVTGGKPGRPPINRGKDLNPAPGAKTEGQG